MTKESRLAFIKSRFRAARSFAAIGASVLNVSAIRESDSRDTPQQITRVMGERLAAMDYSIADSDKIESPISSLIATEEAEEDRWESTLLSVAEKRQLAREMAPLRAFKRDVHALPLLLTA